MFYWVCGVIAAGVTLLALTKFLKNRRKQQIFEKWTVKSQGKIILHGMYGNSQVVPSVSPFVLKLETFLRFAELPYEIDKADFWGPKGKTPWISCDGQHFADSQFIIEHLKREKRISDGLSEMDHSIGTMARLMVEDHLYWCGIMWRFAFGGKDTFQEVLSGKKKFAQWLVFTMIAPQLRSMAWSQGIGRHSEAEVVALMMQDLKALSTILGEKKFLLGENPSEYDCAIFGGLAGAVFMRDSPSPVKEKLNGEFSNLRDFCIRMRETFWPDWDALLMEKSKTN